VIVPVDVFPIEAPSDGRIGVHGLCSEIQFWQAGSARKAYSRTQGGSSRRVEREGDGIKLPIVCFGQKPIKIQGHPVAQMGDLVRKVKAQRALSGTAVDSLQIGRFPTEVAIENGCERQRASHASELGGAGEAQHQICSGLETDFLPMKQRPWGTLVPSQLPEEEFLFRWLRACSPRPNR